MATPHMTANKEDIAKIVLMAGDPLRAQLFAETFLTDIKKVNSIRNMFVFTGNTPSGKTITVMGHGMGMESIGIYAYELYKSYDVETIIRFGSAGAYSKNLNLLDIIIAEEAWTESNYGAAFGEEKDTASADKELIEIATRKVKELNLSNKSVNGKIHSSMWFYQTHNIKSMDWFEERNILGAEMEAYALYVIANALNKKALTVLTVGDHIAKKQELPADERRTAFVDMFDLVLSIVEEI